MPLEPIALRPGIALDLAPDGAQGRYYDAINVRWRNNLPERIGGWAVFADSPLTGIPRGGAVWTTLSQVQLMGFGTEQKLQLVQDGAVFDITPYRATAVLTDPFSTTSGQQTITVTHTSHGALVGDTVVFSGGSAVGGLTVSSSYKVQSVPTADTYTITHASPATSTATGGGSVTASYEITVGNVDSGPAVGWGRGGWNRGGYGGVSKAFISTLEARIWSLDSWGEDLVATYQGGKLWHWDATNGLSTRAQEIADAPASNNRVYVAKADRHLWALGCTTVAGDFNPMCWRWAAQGTFSFTPTDTNTAGHRVLDGGTQIMNAVPVHGGHLILTDSAAFFARYIGPPLIYDVIQIGSSCGAISPHAVASRNGRAYWLGREGFFRFAGTVQPIDCDSEDWLFDQLNLPQSVKITAGVDSRHEEVLWFYPSTTDEVDSHITVSLEGAQPVWHRGDFGRTCWIDDAAVLTNPVAGSDDGTLYLHETGTTANGVDFGYSLETGNIVSAGDDIVLLDAVVPEFKSITGTHTLTVKAKRWPNDTTTRDKTTTITASSDRVSIRNKGRVIQLRMESDNGDFKLGTVRASLKPMGSR